MKLYEFEGHKIFSKVGIESPFFVVISKVEELEQARRRLKFPIVCKVQVLSGKRGKSGGVKVAMNEKQLKDFVGEFLGKDFNGEEVRFIELCKKVDIEAENYISITYDTVLKSPFLLFCAAGGVDIEEVKKTDPQAIIRYDFDVFAGPVKKELEKLGIPSDFAMRLWDAFSKYDCRLVEVNPFALCRAQGKPPKYVAVDSKIILDDAGVSRHRDLNVLPKGEVGAVPTVRELQAREIDAEDYRGTAGSKFIEFDGDIAVLASGGGASLLVMDSMFAAGGKPANYTEYSGNPPREKVEKLTKIALSREGLRGCLVAGAVANFTDIFETLSGFVDGLVQVKPKPAYPIVIRRGGPRLKEAYEMLSLLSKKEGFDIHLYGPETPISVAAKKMVELSEKFKKSQVKSAKL
ncbi:MAG: ATP citrate lyase citrate-binding domain-containing protein [Candidatus Curtissbacteria bacterium]|nr:ATP citrate lyase citrate-binding domain-containing protein [Candidatus Curtissbacteria bacterium]MDZ4209625.1 ATP-grasp domain-containing protein [Candidatus Curtissbacteria bacterium]